MSSARVDSEVKRSKGRDHEIMNYADGVGMYYVAITSRPQT